MLDKLRHKITALLNFKSAAITLTIMLILSMTIYFALTTTLAVTSDPACYLNYGKLISQGRLTFDYPAANLVFDHGGSFPRSVFHGYVFSTASHTLYPIVTSGFPMMIACVIKMFGLAAAIALNMALLPFLLILLWQLLDAALRNQSIQIRYGVPPVAFAYLYTFHKDFIASWVMPYREIPSMTLAFLAIAVLLQGQRNEQKTIASWFMRTGIAGLLIGLGIMTRETVIALLPSLAFLSWLSMPKASSLPKKYGFYMASVVLLFLSTIISYSPQLLINRQQRDNALMVKQFSDRTSFATQKTLPATPKPERIEKIEAVSQHGTSNTANTADHKSAADITNTSSDSDSDSIFAHNIAGRSAYIWTYQTGKFLVPLFLTGMLACVRRKNITFLAITFLPFVMYFLSNSILIRVPDVFSRRYEFSLFLFMAPLAAVGVIELLVLLTQRIKKSPFLNVVHSIVIFSLLSAIILPFHTVDRNRNAASLHDLSRFSNDISAVIPNKSIVLAEYPAKEYFEYFCYGNSVSLFNMMEFGIKPDQVISYCASNNIDLFFVDTPKQHYRETPYSTAELKKSLRLHSDMSLVTTLKTSDYNLQNVFQTSDLSIYSVKMPSGNKQSIMIAPTTTEDNRLEIEVGESQSRPTPSVTCNGTDVLARFISANLITAELPENIATNVISISVSTDSPLAVPVRARLLPKQAALMFRAGYNAEEFPILGENWFRGTSENVRPPFRIMPKRCSLNTVPFLKIYPSHNSLYLGIMPAEIKRIDVCAETTASKKSRPIICVNSDGLASGLVFTDINGEKQLELTNDSKSIIAIHTIALCTSAESASIPAALSSGQRNPWKLILLKNATTETNAIASEIVTGQFAGNGKTALERNSPYPNSRIEKDGSLHLSAGTGNSFLVLGPVDIISGTELSMGRIQPEQFINSICLNGFYPAESSGRWTYPEADFMTPYCGPDENIVITLNVMDQRPNNFPDPTHCELSFAGTTILTTNITDRGIAHIFEAVISGKIFTNDDASPPRIHISTSAWRPMDTEAGNADSRNLGIFIKSVRYETKPVKSRP